jgi:hypothetical protein
MDTAFPPPFMVEETYLSLGTKDANSLEGTTAKGAGRPISGEPWRDSRDAMEAGAKDSPDAQLNLR